MNNELIPDSDVQAAFDWLHEHADICAEAKAHRIYTEEFRKTLKSQIMKEHPKLSNAAQETEAYADHRYAEFLDGLKLAVFNDERERFLKETKLALIDAWRTASSNRRAQV